MGKKKRSIWNISKTKIAFDKPFKGKNSSFFNLGNNLSLGKKQKMLSLSHKKHHMQSLHLSKPRVLASKKHSFSIRSIGMLRDSDRDGVVDALDCRPHDPKMQHVKPSQTMKERLRGLPILFSSSAMDDPQGHRVYYTLDGYMIVNGKKEKAKSIPKGVRTAIQRFYSMIKKRPDVVGEIERKAPRAIIFTIKGGEIATKTMDIKAARGHKFKKPSSIKAQGYQFPTPKGKAHESVKEGKGGVVVRLASPRGYPYRREGIEYAAGTVVHELEHVRQAKAYEDKPKLEKRMRKGSYAKRRIEVLAREADRKAYSKRYRATYGSRKHGAKRFAEMTNDIPITEDAEEENNET